ncbi:MAG TPA: hypothetical protein VLV83_10295 [Acidobacteriota bacterium]|nr:hypothetical protein [Acidobacteriota bacterium]
MKTLFLTLLLMVSGSLSAQSQTASSPSQEAPPEESAQKAPEKASQEQASAQGAYSYEGSFEQEGIRVEFKMRPAEGQLEPGQPLREGDEVDLSFRIRDTNSELPLGGVFPAAWMDRVPENASESETCSERVGAFLSGSLISRAEVDFNVYHVLALNSDNSITVVDPLFGFGTTKLLDLIHLESPGEDWALDRPNKALYVAMPEAGKVAVVDLSTWDVKTNLEAAEGVSRVAVQPDGRYVWASFHAGADSGSSSGVAVFDTSSLQRKAVFATAAGKHELAFTPDSRYAFVSNGGDGSISVFDIRELSEKATVEVGEAVVSIAFSDTAQALYALDPSGSVAVIDGHSHQVRSRITVQPGATQIRFSTRPNLAFVVNPEHDLVNIIDASRNKVVQTGSTEEDPDQVSFTDEIAYIRHRESELILMIPLKELGEEGAPVPVIDFPGGRSPLGKVMPAAADTIVQAPGATAVLVANAADTAIYYYREGMAAPMGHFQNYGRQPRAVMAVDRSLTEFEPGLYGTSSMLRRPGDYELAFFLDSPRIVHCFSVKVAPNPELEAKRRANRQPLVEPLNTIMAARAGEETVLRFRLKDPVSGTAIEGLEDLRILTFRAPGLEQRRSWAEEASPGLYQVTLKPAQSGIYYAFASSTSLGLAYNESPFAVIRVESGSAGAKGDQ